MQCGAAGGAALVGADDVLQVLQQPRVVLRLPLGLHHGDLLHLALRQARGGAAGVRGPGRGATAVAAAAAATATPAAAAAAHALRLPLLPPPLLRLPLLIRCCRQSAGGAADGRACRMRKRLLSRSTPLPLSSAVTCGQGGAGASRRVSRGRSRHALSTQQALQGCHACQAAPCRPAAPPRIQPPRPPPTSVKLERRPSM